MEHVEHPTVVDYVTLRNWRYDPSAGEIWSDEVEKPLPQEVATRVFQHIDFQRYLDAVLARINSDGSLDTPFEVIRGKETLELVQAHPLTQPDTVSRRVILEGDLRAQHWNVSKNQYICCRYEEH